MSRPEFTNSRREQDGPREPALPSAPLVPRGHHCLHVQRPRSLLPVSELRVSRTTRLQPPRGVPGLSWVAAPRPSRGERQVFPGCVVPHGPRVRSLVHPPFVGGCFALSYLLWQTCVHERVHVVNVCVRFRWVNTQASNPWLRSGRFRCSRDTAEGLSVVVGPVGTFGSTRQEFQLHPVPVNSWYCPFFC